MMDLDPTDPSAAPAVPDVGWLLKQGPCGHVSDVHQSTARHATPEPIDVSTSEFTNIYMLLGHDEPYIVEVNNVAINTSLREVDMASLQR